MRSIGVAPWSYSFIPNAAGIVDGAFFNSEFGEPFRQAAPVTFSSGNGHPFVAKATFPLTGELPFRDGKLWWHLRCIVTELRGVSSNDEINCRRTSPHFWLLFVR